MKSTCAASSDTWVRRQATPLLVAGLRKLEYRGYDSAGLAVTDGGRMQVVRCRGKLAGLEDMVAQRAAAGQRRRRPHALGDPRPPVGDQRPPAQDRLGRGRPQRHHREPPGAARAAGGGGAEVLVRDRHRDRRAPDRRGAAGGRADAWSRRCARRCAQVEGAYALAVVSEKHPDQIVAAKVASPLVHRPRARARCSSPPTCPRSWSTRARSSSWTRATSPRSPARASS